MSQANLNIVEHPLIQIRLSKLRDKETSPGDFRRNLREIAQLMTFECTRNFEVCETQIQTPLALAKGAAPARPVILVPILRAGLGMLDGMLEILTDAQIGHIGMYRNEDSLQPESYYCNLPQNIGKAQVVLIDPMLATGNSSVAAASQLKRAGATRVSFLSLVAAPEGVEAFGAAHPDIPLFTAALDDGLNENAYILPGLGDAGDRYFGTL